MTNCGNIKNYVFLGEAGCGKSEISVELALRLSGTEGKRVRFFDLDMTKPLFRSRDLKEELEKAGVDLVYEEQFMDAPVTVGGVESSLNDSNVFTILDVGGDVLGSRAIGMYSRRLQMADTKIYYVINPFRPWSDTLEHIDAIMSKVLQGARLSVENIEIIANPNMSGETTAEDVITGYKRLNEILKPYKEIRFCVASEKLAGEVSEEIGAELFILSRHIIYPWS